MYSSLLDGFLEIFRDLVHNNPLNSLSTLSSLITFFKRLYMYNSAQNGIATLPHKFCELINTLLVFVIE